LVDFPRTPLAGRLLVGPTGELVRGGRYREEVTSSGVASDDLIRALADDGDSLRLRALPPDVRNLLIELNAPPRLAAHLRAVHDVAAQIVAWVKERYPAVDVNAPTVLAAAALHDIGKVVHPDELSGPGSYHEESGYLLLRSHGVVERVAEMVRDHGSWSAGASLDLLLVCLADKVWKDRRQDDLEQHVVDRLASATGEPPWSVFAELDEQLTTLGSRAEQRLAYQNRHAVAAIARGDS
jgi:HD superfamily phosphohydrolase YqeK